MINLFLIIMLGLYMGLGFVMFALLVFWAVAKRGISGVDWVVAIDLFFEMLVAWPVLVWEVLHG